MGTWVALALAFLSLLLWETDYEGVWARGEKKERGAALQKLSLQRRSHVILLFSFLFWLTRLSVDFLGISFGSFSLVLPVWFAGGQGGGGYNIHTP